MADIAPYLGYLASLLLIIALLVNNDLQFRWFNTFGNVSFIIYALVFHAFPVLLTNGILLSINLYYLVKVYSRKEYFDLLEFKGDEKQLDKFMGFYQEDIALYFPGVSAEQMKGNLNFAVTRDLVIANIFSASLDDKGNATVLINYTVKKYRDYKIGRFIFDKEKQYLVSKGIKRIVYTSVFNKKHLAFLKVMEFASTPDGRYVKLLDKG
ncbi:MAG: hypothetical protein ABJA78_01190 [Ferruginibacter sp.]